MLPECNVGPNIDPEFCRLASGWLIHGVQEDKDWSRIRLVWHDVGGPWLIAMRLVVVAIQKLIGGSEVGEKDHDLDIGSCFRGPEFCVIVGLDSRSNTMLELARTLLLRCHELVWLVRTSYKRSR